MLTRQLIGASVLLLPVGLCALLYSGRPKGPFFLSASIDEIEIRLRDFAKRTKEPVSVVSTNKDHIAQLLDLLHKSVPTTDHKCAERGWIVLKTTEADKKVGFLPGHHDDSYEFRYGGKIYKTSRIEFVGALERLGLTNVPLE